MKYVLSVLVFGTVLISVSQCYRIRRQNDAIFFPNEDGPIPGSGPGQFLLPGPIIRPNGRPGRRPGGFPNGNFFGRGPNFNLIGLPNGNFIGGGPNANLIGGPPNGNFIGGGPNGNQLGGGPNGILVGGGGAGGGPGRVQMTPPPQNGNGAARRTTPTPQFLRCMKQCPTTTEYNPVCGSDSIQYHNQQRLNCANRCGANVQFVSRGNCQGNLPTQTIRF